MSYRGPVGSGKTRQPATLWARAASTSRSADHLYLQKYHTSKTQDRICDAAPTTGTPTIATIHTLSMTSKATFAPTQCAMRVLALEYE